LTTQELLDVQVSVVLAVILPLESGTAWNVAAVQTNVSADAGSASATPERATAAASTRRVNRFVCISFTSKKAAAVCRNVQSKAYTVVIARSMHSASDRMRRRQAAPCHLPSADARYDRELKHTLRRSVGGWMKKGARPESRPSSNTAQLRHLDAVETTNQGAGAPSEIVRVPLWMKFPP
jgi:hypothetical protein